MVRQYSELGGEITSNMNGEFQFSYLLDNFFHKPNRNQIVSKAPAIVRRAREASPAVKGARLLPSSAKPQLEPQSAAAA